MKIIIKTLGCKANRYESDRIQDKFGDRFVIADAQMQKLDKADVIIVNTCTVTHVADRKSRQAIAGLKKKHPNAKVIVFGCGANTNNEEYKNLKNVDFVIQKPEKLDELLNNLADEYPCDTSTFNINRTRTLIKIQDGCNNFCSYCIVPYARGREKSRQSIEIINEINQKSDKGYKEVVLTGINIGEWKEEGKDLADLIQLILDDTTIERLRLSSIEPQNFSQKFVDLFSNPRFCPHLHISLQSGSNTILKTMRRRYDAKFYNDIVDRLRSAVPHMSITTDVIVGFPGETEELFEETVEYVKKLKFSKIHIFPYSIRKGTLAAEMPDQIPYEIKKDRCQKLAIVEKELRENFYKQNIGRDEKILIEFINKDGFGIGFTSNYLKTRIQKNINPEMENTIISATLSKAELLES